jgi:hypothetical protein
MYHKHKEIYTVLSKEQEGRNFLIWVIYLFDI